MKNIAMLFPGQGSQYVGMAQQLYQQDEATRQLFRQAGEVLALDMVKLCFQEQAAVLNQTQYTQPALVLCAVAAYRHFVASTGLTPVVLAGHSIGEISALIAAEALDFADGLTLAKARGEAMAACCAPGDMAMMAVVKLPRAQVEQICQLQPGYGSSLVIANYNSPAQLVLSGSVAALSQVEIALKAAGASCIMLRVSGAFHSPLMQPAVAQLQPLLQQIRFHPPKIPVIANVNAQPYPHGADIASSLLQQICAPVLWQDSLEQLAAGQFSAVKLSSAQIDLYLEVGPGVVLKKLTQMILPKAQVFSLDQQEDAAPLQRQLEIDIRNLAQRPAFLGKCLAVAVATRNQNFDEHSYREGVVLPYQRLRELHEQLESAQATPDLSQMQQGLSWLRQIMISKQVPQQEQQQRLYEILRMTQTEALLAELPEIVS
jgi:[acyl-carrier-protein] S-malonyltransferase